MRGVIFDNRQVLRVNYATNRKMNGPLPWDNVSGDSTNTRVLLAPLANPVPTAFYGTRSVPTGAVYMGTFEGINKTLIPNQGGPTQIVPDRVTDVNISLYVHANRAANVEVGIHDPDGEYGVPTPWFATVAIPANTWTRVDVDGPANIGDDPLNLNGGQCYALVTPSAGPALVTDIVHATAAQVTSGVTLYSFIDHDITDEWLDVERAAPDQTGVITSIPNIGPAVRHEVDPTGVEVYPWSVE